MPQESTVSRSLLLGKVKALRDKAAIVRHAAEQATLRLEKRAADLEVLASQLPTTLTPEADKSLSQIVAHWERSADQDGRG